MISIYGHISHSFNIMFGVKLLNVKTLNIITHVLGHFTDSVLQTLNRRLVEEPNKCHNFNGR